MSNRIEYLYAASVTIADAAARKKGWRQSGRAAWLKADGTTVHFICFEEQLASVPDGVTVHRAQRSPRGDSPVRRTGRSSVSSC